MEKFDEWFLPTGETHLQDWMRKKNQRVQGRLTYQYHKYVEAIKLCKQRRTSIDVGAHVGLFAYWMAQDFATVEAFEPLSHHRECFAKNVTASNVRMYPFALGEHLGHVGMKTAPTSSGDSYVSGVGTIEMRRLDDFDLQDVDFCKLDTEGYELFALRGGEETLKRCKPVICVEQKPGKAQQFGLPQTGAVSYLQGLGAKLRIEIAGDYLLSWD